MDYPDLYLKTFILLSDFEYFHRKLKSCDYEDRYFLVRQLLVSYKNLDDYLSANALIFKNSTTEVKAIRKTLKKELEFYSKIRSKISAHLDPDTFKVARNIITVDSWLISAPKGEIDDLEYIARHINKEYVEAAINSIVDEIRKEDEEKRKKNPNIPYFNPYGCSYLELTIREWQFLDVLATLNKQIIDFLKMIMLQISKELPELSREEIWEKHTNKKNKLDCAKKPSFEG